MEKKHPPPFLRGLHSNPAGYLGKGFLNYKHKNNVARSTRRFLKKFGIIEVKEETMQYCVINITCSPMQIFPVFRFAWTWRVRILHLKKNWIVQSKSNIEYKCFRQWNSSLWSSTATSRYSSACFCAIQTGSTADSLCTRMAAKF